MIKKVERSKDDEQSISSLNSLSTEKTISARKSSISTRPKSLARPSVPVNFKKSTKTVQSRKSTPLSNQGRRASSKQLKGDSTSSTKSNVSEKSSQIFRLKYERAIQENKVFWLQPAHAPIRNALLSRGWVEKSPNLSIYLPLQNAKQKSVPSLPPSSFQNKSKEAWTNRLLETYPPDFVWTHRGSNLRWSRLVDKQIVNIHPNAVFTTKVGITNSIQNSQWIGDHSANILFPRCYRLNNREERSAFQADYRLTACISLLQWFVGAYELHGIQGVFAEAAGVSPNCLEFAMIQIKTYVKIREHEDLDWKFTPLTSKEKWREFIKLYSLAVCQDRKIAPKSPSHDLDYAQKVYRNCKTSLQAVAPFWSQMNNDGVHNLWICKPGHKSRGSGIVLKNNLDEIIQLYYLHRSEESARESEWVVQKYIERPLLVFNTKFDIRQWFLVSDWNPLTVWVYKESYLRFCSQEYTLYDLHSSIHLCNNAVQAKYKNDPSRSKILPEENMWDHYTFLAYLKSQEKADMWDSVIYPGMKKAILGVLLASNEDIMIRKNSFELYGADFMLATDYLPWLIEINAGPSLAYTTSVTQRLCRQVMVDVIKVVIDRLEDPNADTGMFELIYKQHRLPKIPHSESTFQRLHIQGDPITKPKNHYDAADPTNHVPLPMKKKSMTINNFKPLVPADPTPVISSTEGLGFVNFVDRLHLKDSGVASPLTGNAGRSTGANSPEGILLDPLNSKLSKLMTNPPISPPSSNESATVGNISHERKKSRDTASTDSMRSKSKSVGSSRSKNHSKQSSPNNSRASPEKENRANSPNRSTMNFRNSPNRSTINLRNSPTRSKTGPSNTPIQSKDISKNSTTRAKDDPKNIPFSSKDDPKIVPMRSKDVQKSAPIRNKDVSKNTPMRSKDDPKSTPIRNKDDPKSAPIRNKDDPKNAPIRNKDDPKIAPIRNKDDPKNATIRNKDDPKIAPIRNKDDLKSTPTRSTIDSKIHPLTESIRGSSNSTIRSKISLAKSTLRGNPTNTSISSTRPNGNPPGRPNKSPVAPPKSNKEPVKPKPENSNKSIKENPSTIKYPTPRTSRNGSPNPSPKLRSTSPAPAPTRPPNQVHVSFAPMYPTKSNVKPDNHVNSSRLPQLSTHRLYNLSMPTKSPWEFQPGSSRYRSQHPPSSYLDRVLSGRTSSQRRHTISSIVHPPKSVPFKERLNRQINLELLSEKVSANSKIKREIMESMSSLVKFGSSPSPPKKTRLNEEHSKPKQNPSSSGNSSCSKKPHPFHFLDLVQIKETVI